MKNFLKDQMDRAEEIIEQYNERRNQHEVPPVVISNNDFIQLLILKKLDNIQSLLADMVTTMELLPTDGEDG